MKKLKYVLFLLVVLNLLPIHAFAESVTTGRVITEVGVRIRSGTGTNYAILGVASYNSRITILSTHESGNGCNKEWLKVSTNGIQGYACSDYIGDIETKELTEEEIAKQKEEKALSEIGDKMVSLTDEEFEQYLTSQGFPESYKIYLRQLHKSHPAWIFKAVKTKYNWTTAVNLQDVSGRSLLNVGPVAVLAGNEGYLSVAPEDYDHNRNSFIPHDGTYWFQANRETIAYLMDPRNFLNEKEIFMFEELFYHPTYQKEELVKNALSSEFLKQYSSYFMEASEASKVSPIFLASLVKQEVGTSNTNICTNGKAGILSDGVDYSNYYNFFNIGAYSSNNPKLMSLMYAKRIGWNTPQKAIVEGSMIISNNYVNCGQHTSYFQKFNVAASATKDIWHQYTTNVNALSSPAKSAYNAYKSAGLIEKDFVFDIPVFEGMPEKTILPKEGNPNNWLKELKVNGSLVSNFDSDNLNYTMNVSYTENVMVSATPVASTSSVTGVGTIALNQDTTVVNVVVTAQNESTKTYTITINRAPKPVEETPVVPEVPTPTPPVNDDNKENEVTPPSDDNKTEEQKNDDNNNGNDNQDGGTDNKQQEEVKPIVDTVNLEEVLKDSSFKYSDKYLWNVTLGSTVSSITEELTKKYNTITVNIYDRNNNAKSQGTIVSGDKVVISSNGVTKTLSVVIYGDVDGNGTITAVDLLHVQKHLLGFTKLTDSLLMAADVNKDSKVSAVDLLQIQKHLLKYTNISQG